MYREYDPKHFDEEPYDIYSKSCKYCGKPGLGWKQKRDGTWILVSKKGSPHTCREKTTGFQKISKYED